MLRTFLRLLLFFAVFLAFPPSARAADPLGLVVFGDLPREDLRAGLERSIGRPVELRDASSAGAAHVTVTWHRERSELAVAYDEPGRGTVSRIVRARPTPAQCAEDAVVLATSLVQNEADELLGKPAPPPAPPPPPPAAEPAPAPPPPPPPAAEPAPAAPASVTTRDVIVAYASLFHPLATNWDHAYATTRFGLDLLYGRAGELDDGAQIGIVNILAGKEGVATGNMSGVQLGLGMNFASGHAVGLQLAWLGGNAAGEGLDGVQVAFLTNVAAGPMRGVQVSALNVAGDVSGVQVGLVNVGKKVKGLTLGVINVADDVEGVPLGLISVTRSGGIHPVLWGGSMTYANGGIQFATRHTYTMVAAHYTVAGSADYAAVGARPALHLDARGFVGGGFFVGGHVPIDDSYIEFDLGFSGYVAPDRTLKTTTNVAYHEVLLEPRLRVMAGYSFAEHASLFGGVALVTRARIVEDGGDAFVTVLPEVFGGFRF